MVRPLLPLLKWLSVQAHMQYLSMILDALRRAVPTACFKVDTASALERLLANLDGTSIATRRFYTHLRQTSSVPRANWRLEPYAVTAPYRRRLAPWPVFSRWIWSARWSLSVFWYFGAENGIRPPPKRNVSDVKQLAEPQWLAGRPEWRLYALASPQWRLSSRSSSSGQGGSTGLFLSGSTCTR